MKRRLFTILSALSLLLFVAVVVLWARSRVYSEGFSEGRVFRTQNTHSLRSIVSWNGILRVSAWRTTYTERRDLTRPRYSSNAYQHPWRYYCRDAPLDGRPKPYRHQQLGFDFVSRRDLERSGAKFTGFSLELPYWFLAVLLAITPSVHLAAVLRGRRAAKRSRLGLCPSCNYDLRATPGRCPECGLVPAAPPTTPPPPREDVR